MTDTSICIDASMQQQARQLQLAEQRELERQCRIEHVQACSAARFDVNSARNVAAAADAAVSAVAQVTIRADIAETSQMRMCVLQSTFASLAVAN